ncbi:MAG: hypothetical protein LBK65_07040, partial [Tannerellaceae bacterium]|nr:hypothetical protein [Tannerellaceae bacterium]
VLGHDITLWSATNIQGPCPDGWRLPSKAEGDPISTENGVVPYTSILEADKLAKVAGDISGEYLIFPVGSIISESTGKLLTGNTIKSTGAMWTYEVNGNKSYYFALGSNRQKPPLSFARGAGLFVRCIQR